VIFNCDCLWQVDTRTFDNKQFDLMNKPRDELQTRLKASGNRLNLMPIKLRPGFTPLAFESREYRLDQSVHVSLG
jgi:acyl CoA:acetate/3-ketoacid CoA transferase alpha subunit